MSCQDAANIPGGGAKACSYGCLGLGSCVKACEFDAIHIVNGKALVDRENVKPVENVLQHVQKDLFQ